MLESLREVFSSSIRTVRNADKKYPGLKFLSLWILVVLILILFPFQKGKPGAVLFSILFSLILLSSVLSAVGSRRAKVGVIIFTSLAVVARWSYLFLGGTLLEGLSFLFAALTLGMVSFLLLSNMFTCKEVTSITIWQAISVYILLGLTWAAIYALLYIQSPGSFADSSYPNMPMAFPTFIYFSFVTLATLGYGDIVPVSPEARGLAIVEVLMGVLYMAILISRLVGTWKPMEERERRRKAVEVATEQKEDMEKERKSQMPP